MFWIRFFEGLRYFGSDSEELIDIYRMELPIYWITRRTTSLFFEEDIYYSSNKITDYTRSLSFEEFLVEMGFRREFLQQIHFETNPELYLPTLIWEIHLISSPNISLQRVSNRGKRVLCPNLLAWFRWNFSWIHGCFSYLQDSQIIRDCLFSSEDWENVRQRLEELAKEYPVCQTCIDVGESGKDIPDHKRLEKVRKRIT